MLSSHDGAWDATLQRFCPHQPPKDMLFINLSLDSAPKSFAYPAISGPRDCFKNQLPVNAAPHAAINFTVYALFIYAAGCYLISQKRASMSSRSGQADSMRLNSASASTDLAKVYLLFQP